MAYDILMPQLSDSMDEGKLISWKVKEGESVKKGDVIAEVESDKAIMEIQSFKEGVISNIAVKEGENVSVGTIIASIDTDGQGVEKASKQQPETPKITIPKKEETPAPSAYVLKDTYHDSVQKAVQGDASPKAKQVASHYDINIEALQKENKLPTPAHEEDIHTYYQTRFFTPKALAVLKQYHLDASLFSQEKKHDSASILDYIQAHDIPLPKQISSFQKSLIASVETSAKKPIYHVYDSIDAILLTKHKEHTMTVWLIKIFAEALMQHEVFRNRLRDDSMTTSPNASISLAVSYHDTLYMPVVKDANLLTAQSIEKQLKSHQESVKQGTITREDMEGSTFGISNLGMFGIERFDAMINKDDTGIAAIGAMKDEKISVTLTLDHRLVNGNQAATFMQTLKTLAQDELFFKEV